MEFEEKHFDIYYYIINNISIEDSLINMYKSDKYNERDILYLLVGSHCCDRIYGDINNAIRKIIELMIQEKKHPELIYEFISKYNNIMRHEFDSKYYINETKLLVCNNTSSEWNVSCMKLFRERHRVTEYVNKIYNKLNKDGLKKILLSIKDEYYHDNNLLLSYLEGCTAYFGELNTYYIIVNLMIEVFDIDLSLLKSNSNVINKYIEKLRVDGV